MHCDYQNALSTSCQLSIFNSGGMHMYYSHWCWFWSWWKRWCLLIICGIPLLRIFDWQLPFHCCLLLKSWLMKILSDRLMVLQLMILFLIDMWDINFGVWWLGIFNQQLSLITTFVSFLYVCDLWVLLIIIEFIK